MSYPPGDLWSALWRGPLGGEVHCVPVLHGRVEFAEAVGRAFRSLAPTRVAVELPGTLKAAYLKAVARLPRVSVLVYETAECPAYLIVEPADPFAECVRRALVAGMEVDFVDADVDDPPERFDPAPDSYALHRIGHKAYVEEWLSLARPPSDPTDAIREKAMAAGLAKAAAAGERILFVCGLAHALRVGELLGGPHAEVMARTAPRRPMLFHLSPSSMAEAASEIPFAQAVYEVSRLTRPDPPTDGSATVRKRVGALELITGKAGWREEEALNNAVLHAGHQNGAPASGFDRQKALYHLCLLAGTHYAQETGEKLEPWQRRALFKFLRNWALLEGRLLPDLYQLIEAAKGVVDDNYAYALWRLASHTPWQEGEAEIPVATVTADMLGYGRRTVRMRRRLGRSKRRPVSIGRGKRKGVDPARWLEGFKGEGICSWPPEDVQVEGFGRWLQKKAKAVWSEEHSRTLPFRGSMEDGIDVRETVRRLPEGEIYVRRKARIPGSMGSVVVIFDEDSEWSRHPFRMTWLGEHSQESDMAFYATDPMANVAGPGICRVEYGGFFLSYPPLRLYDVWTDPDYAWTVTPAERLLAAAIEYSLEDNVVYCAPRPPRAFFRQFAARLGRRIVYVPKGSLGPRALKKMRVMHVLDGKSVRGVAADYIW